VAKSERAKDILTEEVREDRGAAGLQGSGGEAVEPA
jgi:hypothetical protein